jgi:hypothetical protein
MTSAERVVQVLLNRDGRLYSEVLGLDLRPGSVFEAPTLARTKDPSGRWQ